MALSHTNIGRLPISTITGALLEKVILSNDLAGLSSIEKVQYVTNICQTIGLNPVTKPIQLLKFNGKETPYFTKDATEQLRKINNISLSIKETKMIDDLYIVIAEATTPDGRKDSSTAAVVVNSLKGEAKANAFMKAETKAKRRVTLSICGLGFMDESEISSIPNAHKISIDIESSESKDELFYLDYLSYKDNIENSKSMEELKDIFDKVKKLDFKYHPELLKELLNSKDKRKSELSVMEFNNEYDSSTGEIKKNY